MECNFYVGQKVVCVDADGVGSSGSPLIEGRTYTIRDLGPLPQWQTKIPGVPADALGVRLKELRRWSPEQDPEGMYYTWRFRPLIETDISVFQAMLNPTPKQVREFEEA